MSDRDQELDRRRREMDAAHRALDELGVPREVDGEQLALHARVNQVRAAATRAAREEILRVVQDLVGSRSTERR